MKDSIVNNTMCKRSLQDNLYNELSDLICNGIKSGMVEDTDKAW